LQTAFGLNNAAVFHPLLWTWPVMIIRAEFWATLSSAWFAKNMIALSMIANNRAKNNGATSANSTAAEPRRLPRKRRNTLRNEAVELAGDGIEKSPAKR
jgi:hypothetical protein